MPDPIVTLVLPEPQPTGVTITLSIEDAEILLKVCNCVGGEPSGPRGRMSAIGLALENVGIKPAKIHIGSRNGHHNNALYIERFGHYA